MNDILSLPHCYPTPRPTIAESVAESSPGRQIHIWQMQDPHASEDWLSLPVLMSQYADKTFAQYQLEIFEARKLFEKGRIKETKLISAKSNSIRPLVLMHSSGEPASSRYIKDHLSLQDGKLKLKARAFPKHNHIPCNEMSFSNRRYWLACKRNMPTCKYWIVTVWFPCIYIYIFGSRKLLNQNVWDISQLPIRLFK